MSSYDKVRAGKLSFKGGLDPSKKIDKKKKKNKKAKTTLNDSDEQNPSQIDDGQNVGKQVSEIDTGTGHAPGGKKSKNYEDLFPVETKRFGYEIQKEVSREAALDARAKKKADRYCK